MPYPSPTRNPSPTRTRSFRPRSLRRGLGGLLATGGALVLLPSAARGQVVLKPYITSGLNSPIFATAPTGDPSRLFILERGGRVRLSIDGVLQPGNVLDISGRVRTDGEHGLLGMAFPPDFATNPTFFLDYSNANGDNVIERFTLPTGSNTAASSTGTVMLTIPTNGQTNHKAGWIGFRPGENNNLYIATGDSGGGNDGQQFAQNINETRGKILRVNVSGSVATAPADNPFAGATPGNDFVYAYGLRNPFRDSFDRETGAFYIADVGQNTREEINAESRPAAGSPTVGGRNYGWRAREGTGDNPGVGDAAPAGAVNPIYDYVHGGSTFSPAGQSASITGGYVYRGPMARSLTGQYLFGDYISGKIGALTWDPITNTATNVTDLTPILDPTGSLIGRFNLVSFGEDGVGNVFLVDDGGELYRLESNTIVPEPGGLVMLVPALMGLRRRR